MTSPDAGDRAPELEMSSGAQGEDRDAFAAVEIEAY